MKEEETLLPYTVEELLERAEEGRRQIALGNYTEVEDFLRELDKDCEEEANKSAFTAAEELHYCAIIRKTCTFAAKLNHYEQTRFNL